MPARQFPFRPHLDQLRNQAKDLLRDVRAGAPSALDAFREFHPERIKSTPQTAHRCREQTVAETGD